MLSYSTRRIVLLVPVLFGLSVLVFLLLHLAPGDPVIAQIGMHPTAETVDASAANWASTIRSRSSTWSG